MIFKAEVTAIFECSIERAFKTPMLCDLSKIHTGSLFFPKVLFTTNDSEWGKIGSSKRTHVAKSISQKGGYIFTDKVLERVENRYWKIQLDDFQAWMFGFDLLVGEWHTTELATNKILVNYKYFLHSESYLLRPLQWLFVKTFWKSYMKQVIQNVKDLAYKDEPYQFQ